MYQQSQIGFALQEPQVRVQGFPRYTLNKNKPSPIQKRQQVVGRFSGNNNQYQNIMQSNTMIIGITPLFASSGLSPQVIAQLAAKTVEAECVLYIDSRPNTEVMIDQSQQENIVLQVVEGHVLQRSADRTRVISGFLCDYEHQFEIIRRAPSVPNRLGEPEGIRMILKQQPNNPVQLMAKPENKKELQKFGKILGRNFIVQLGFHSSFKAIKKIGKGMTACVYNAINFANGKEVAIKSFKRSVYFSQDNGNGKISFMKEFKILTEVNHKNICQIYSVYETQNSTYVILQLYPLSLYGYLQKFGFPSVEQAKVIMINLLEGISYLHEKGIMHRDLKLENIMVKKEEGRSGRIIPVIVDLGLAEYTSSTKYLYTRCGTPGYVAPEVLKIKSTDPSQTYSCACDVFSLGVIFHILLFKKPLFEGKEVREVIKKNSECDIDFSNQNFQGLDEAARDLMSRLLCKDPTARITAAEALSHPFLIDERKKLEIEAESIFRTSYSILT